MEYEWNLREEILKVTHRWPYPLLAFLIGCLVGLVISWIFPPRYRAETRILVAYNADGISRNPDDYKNWQMRQLDALTTSEDILQESLLRLRARDPYWAAITVGDLRKMLHVSWRNTGAWRLSAVNPDQVHAAHAVEIWSDVVLEAYQTASGFASALLPLDKQIMLSTQSQTADQARIEQLKGLNNSLQTWQTELAQQPYYLTIDSLTRWKILSQTAQAAGLDPGWSGLLSEFPNELAPPEEYLAWLSKALSTSQGEINSLESQLAALKADKDSAYSKYVIALDKSRGLSATLIIDRPFRGVWQIEAIRPTSRMALIGGMLGLLVWSIVWIARLTLRK